MAEDKQIRPDSAPAEREAEAADPPVRPSPRARTSQQRRQRNSVFQYIAILFAAAFLLLLFTFVMERRQHELLLEENEEQINNLQQSVTAVQSLQSLYDENAALKEQVDELEARLDEAERELDVLPDTISHLETSLEQTSAAMDWFWQIDEAYVRGRYALCRDLIERLEAANLVEWLPKESITDTDRFSPYDRYQEIYDALY